MISVYAEKKVAHITIDSGATVSFIIKSEAQRLGYTIEEASQLARQADGATNMPVLGEIHGKVTRGAVIFEIHALVVHKLDDATFLVGMNFLIENKVTQEPHKHRIVVDNKYTIEETPAKFIYPPDTQQTKTINIKKLSVVPHNETFEIRVPEEYKANSRFIIDSTDQANSDQNWLFQEVEAVNRTLTVVNESGKPVMLGKNGDTSVIKIRPVVDISIKKAQIIKTEDASTFNAFKKVEDTKNYVVNLNQSFNEKNPIPKDVIIPEKAESYEFLNDIYIEPGVMNDDQSRRMKDILQKYHKVFDNDISEGYNNGSGEFDVDWNWLNDQKPPPGVSKQEVYTNEEMNKIKQDKIDWMESQNICFKAHLLGVPVKYASLTMLVAKSSLKSHEGPLHHGLYRFVNLFNQLNEYIALEPSQPESIDSVLYDAGQWNFMISGDLTNSFYQRWIAKRKLPFMAFHSPYKGMYILARSAQGMKNQSEGLDQMMRVVLGDLIKEGKARKIADDVQAGGNTIDEAIDNFSLVLEEFDKNNIKMAPKKTKIFAKELKIFGWIKEGQILKPDSHSVLAIEKSDKPKTITELRSYLGQYRVFYKNMKNMSLILQPLEKITGEKDKKKEIIWTEELNKAYDDSKIALKSIEPLYLPKRSDKLAITLDWSKAGIGATLFALLEDKKAVVAYFSSTLSGNQSRWPPCDGEGLAACASIDRFSNYIRQALHPTLICSDSKPVVQAVFLLMRGFFSSSQRLNRLLSNSNTFPIDFHHLSGKLSLNEESDTLSRNPSLCEEKECPVCSLIAETADALDESPTARRNKAHPANIKHVQVKDTLLNPAACNPDCHTCAFLIETNLDVSKTIDENLQNSLRKVEIDIQDIFSGSKPFPNLDNRKLLIQIQMKDPVLAKLREDLQSGHRPNNRNTKSNDLKTYLGFKPKISHDGLIVIDRVIKPYLHKITVPVIPPSFAKSVMLAAHIKLKHPKIGQFEKLTSRSFCTLKSKNLIEELSRNCFICQADLNLPKDIPDFKTETKPEHPGSHWGCDVLKHGSINIMVSTDNFSSFTICKIIPSEKQNDCENAIISSIFPFKAATGGAIIRVDTAPGISAIINHRSEAFKEAELKLEPGDVKNKNSCAKVDKTMAELRSILRVVSPEGSQLSELNLQKATETLNMRIRNMNLSAREIMFSRLQNTNENIKLDDKVLSDVQHDNRLKANSAASKNKTVIPKPSDLNEIKLHSLVFLKHDVAKDKSKVRDLYIVMDLEKDSKISIQKVMHPFTNNKSEINNRQKYRVKKKEVYLAPSQGSKVESRNDTKVDEDNSDVDVDVTKTGEPPDIDKIVIPKLETHQIKPRKFYTLPDSDDSDDDDIYSNEDHDNSNRTRVEVYNDTEGVEVVIDKEVNLIDLEPPCIQLVKPSKTYSRPRLNTFPLMSSKRFIPRHQRLSPQGVYHRWLLYKNSEPPDLSIDTLPSISSSIVETLDDNNDAFGVLQDDSDDETVGYLAIVAEQVALEALDEDDEVFDDDQFNQSDHNLAMMEDRNQLDLQGDFVQPGRVYRLDNRLAVSSDKIYIKQKRLVGSSASSTGDTRDKKMKKKKNKSKIRWFIKKMVFSKKTPENDDQDPPATAEGT